MPSRIVDHDERLWMGEDTTVDEVVHFVRSRLAEPSTLNGTVVWNFHNRDLDARAIVNADLNDGHYVVPYQASGAWGWMVEILPPEIANAPILVYRSGPEEYRVHENFRAREEIDDAALRAAHDEMIQQYLQGGEES